VRLVEEKCDNEGCKRHLHVPKLVKLLHGVFDGTAMSEAKRKKGLV
jgi:hypothetical protein